MTAAVDRPGLRWRGAAVVLDRASGSPLRASDGYRIASITKTFTSAAILRLADRGSLTLRAPVARYLPVAYRQAALRDGGYDTGRITVRMLLQHTAGLYDYAGTGAYLQALLADPGHRWSRLEQLRFAMANGEPVAPPGRSCSYSDTRQAIPRRWSSAWRRSPARTPIPSSAFPRERTRGPQLHLRPPKPAAKCAANGKQRSPLPAVHQRSSPSGRCIHGVYVTPTSTPSGLKRRDVV